MRNHKMIHPIGGIPIILASLLLVSVVNAGTVKLPEGQEVKIKFPPQTKISSGTLEEGTQLVIELAEPIQIGGITIVEAGAQGTAKVAKVKKAGRGGSPGMIEVTFIDLLPKGQYKSADNAPIPLGGNVINEGGGKKILSYLFIAGLFIKGGQGEIKPETVYTGKIAKAVALQSE